MTEPHQVRNGCSDDEVVRREVERHSLTILDLSGEFGDYEVDSEAAESIVRDVLDCLCALAAGKPWPESPKP